MNGKPLAASGYVWAWASTACLGGIFVLSKYALQTLSRATFLPLWFLVATLASFAYLYVSHQRHQVLAAMSIWQRVLAVGLLDGVGMFAFFLEIELIDPTLVSFFANMTTVYNVLFGILFFKERLTYTELLGMLFVLGGACTISYRSGQIVFLAFLLAIFVHTLFRSLSYVVAKPVAAQIGPEVLVGFRNLVLFLLSVVYALILARSNLQVPSAQASIATFVGALLGPFLGIVLLYRALSLIDLAKVGIIRGTMPVFVSASAVLAFGTIPRPHQIIGGVMTIAGVFALYAERKGPGG